MLLLTYEKPETSDLVRATEMILRSEQDKNTDHVLEFDGVSYNATPNAYEADE